MSRGFLTRAVLATLLAAGLTAEASAKTSARRKAPDATPLTAEAINGAAFAEPGQGDAAGGGRKPGDKAGKKAGKGRPDPLLIKVQVLLDRAHFSPGAIDGRDGENLRHALSAFAVAQGLPATQTLTAELFRKLQATGDAPVAVDYTLTEADAAGPYVETIPKDLEKQADLDALGYTSPREMLAERFHMSRDLLSALNPGKPLDQAGTTILVAGVAPMSLERPGRRPARRPEREAGGKERGEDGGSGGGKQAGAETGTASEQKPEPGADRSVDKGADGSAGRVERIEVDKASRDVRAFDREGRLVAYYPASIGSAEKPAPSGDTKVTGVAFDPTYTYNPKYAFKGVKATSKFTIKAGPNNPVGLVWIDLAIPSYGIHGTPEPEVVGKAESHGCIRLTNWDVRDLAARVTRGAKVAFKDE